MRQARPEYMVPPFLSTSLFPIHTPWAPKHPLHPTLLCSPPSATPSTIVLLHHAGADTPTPLSITRDQPLSSTPSDWDPCIPSSRFIPAVVHLAGAAPTTVSSIAPRRHRLPSYICFHAADSHRYRSPIKFSPDAYMASQERWYSSICA